MQLGKALILAGIVCIVVGVLFTFAPKLPHLGRLPGDIYIKKQNFAFYFPITTSLVISFAGIIVSLLVWFFRGK